MSSPVSNREPRRDLQRFIVQNQLAIVVALAVSCLFSAVSITIPPAMFADSGYGFAAWHGTLQNQFNSIIQPSQLDISKDTFAFLATWSPGQYLLPGVLTLLGLKLGEAIILVVIACSISAAIGWLKVLARFSTLNEYAALCLVLLLLTARYATLPYGIYNGGEILLQGLLPWLALWSFDVPQKKPGAALLSALCLTLAAFVAKLSGLIVVVVLISASALTFLLRQRRFNRSLVAACAGTLILTALVYYFYIARGWTALSGSGWHVSLARSIAPFVLPWFAGLSLGDALSFLLQNPHHALMRNSDLNIFILTPAALVALFLFLHWKPQTEQTRALKLFTGIYFVLNGLIFVELLLHGGIDPEERHFRLIGLLFIICAAVAAHELISARKIYWVLPVLLSSLYGLASFAVHATANMTATETHSWTAQPTADKGAIDYLQQAFQRDRRSSIFVLTSADQEVILPYQARTLVLEVDFTPLSNLPISYHGRVQGKIYIIIADRLATGEKARRVINAFENYHSSHRLRFGHTSVFVLS